MQESKRGPLLRIGMVGLGNGAANALNAVPGLRAFPNVRVTAGADLRQEALDRFASDFGGETYRSVEDVRRAGEIMEELGYTRGEDRVLRTATGERLAIELRTTRGDDLQERGMLAVADYWQRIGVNAEQVSISAQLQRDREYRASRPAFEVVRNPNGTDALMRYHGSQVPLAENNYVGVNRIRYRNAAFDSLIDRSLTTIPFKERVEIVGQIVHQMTSEVLVLGLFYDPDIMLIGNRIQKVIPSEQLWNVFDWEVAP